MINEVIEVQQYLEGKKIVKKNLYRICYMLAKWYKEQGLSKLEIREEIFNWANSNQIYIKFNLNDMIQKAVDDKERLKDNFVIRINENDIYEINRRFDNPKTKYVALAILCYAKANANRDKEFELSSVALSSWLNMDSTFLKRKYIKELESFDYIQLVKKSHNTYSWDKNNSNKSCVYTLSVPIHNSGNFILEDNNIEGLFRSIFERCI